MSTGRHSASRPARVWPSVLWPAMSVASVLILMSAAAAAIAGLDYVVAALLAALIPLSAALLLFATPLGDSREHSHAGA